MWILQLPFRSRLGDGLRDSAWTLRNWSLPSGYLHIRSHCTSHNRCMLQALGMLTFCYDWYCSCPIIHSVAVITVRYAVCADLQAVLEALVLVDFRPSVPSWSRCCRFAPSFRQSHEHVPPNGVLLLERLRWTDKTVCDAGFSLLQNSFTICKRYFSRDAAALRRMYFMKMWGLFLSRVPLSLYLHRWPESSVIRRFFSSTLWSRCTSLEKSTKLHLESNVERACSLPSFFNRLMLGWLGF